MQRPNRPKPDSEIDYKLLDWHRRRRSNYSNKPEQLVSYQPNHQPKTPLNKKLLRKLGATATAIALIGGYNLFQSDDQAAANKSTNTPAADQLLAEDLIAPSEFNFPEQEANINILKQITLPADSGNFKSFMDYRMITDETSRQHQLLQSPQITTNEQGLRCYKLNGQEYPLVAVGSGISTEIGQRVNFIIESESQNINVFEAIIGDLKDDNHTISPDHLFHQSDFSVVEGLVDHNMLIKNQPLAAKMGDLSYLKDNSQSPTAPSPLQGYVVRVDVLNQIVDY